MLRLKDSIASLLGQTAGGSRNRAPEISLAAENVEGGWAGASIATQRSSLVFEIFSPGSPVSAIDLFAGRAVLIDQLVRAVEEKRNHVIVSGPRGVGKSSLAIHVKDIFDLRGSRTVYTSCSRNNSLADLVTAIAARLPFRFHRNSRNVDLSDASAPTSFADLLPTTHLTPQGVGELFAEFSGTRVVVVLDEFDRLAHPVITQIGELLKVMGDHSAPFSFLMVGIESRERELVEDQRSTARSLFSVRLAAMTDAEISELLARAAGKLDITFEPEVLARLVRISNGKPFVARMAALSVAKFTVMRQSMVVTGQDLMAGVRELWSYLDSIGISRALVAALEPFPERGPMLRDLLAVLRSEGDEASREKLAERSGQAPQILEFLQRASVEPSPIVQPKTGASETYEFQDQRVEIALGLLAESTPDTQPSRA